MWLKRLLTLILFMVFVSQLITAGLKFMDGQPSTTVSFVEKRNLSMPAITMCSVNTSAFLHRNFELQDTFEQEFEVLNRSNGNFIRAAFANFGSNEVDLFLVNLRNRSEVEAKGLDYDKMWTSFAWPHMSGPGLMFCITFTAPTPVFPSPEAFAMLAFDTPPGIDVVVKVHEQDQRIAVSDMLLGSGSTVITSLGKEDSQNIYRIFWTRVESLPGPDRFCDISGESKTEECIAKYIDDQLGCTLPWKSTPSTLNTCTDKSKTEEYINLTLPLRRMSLNEIHDTTGCLANCGFDKFTLSFLGTNVQITSQGLPTIMFSMNDPVVQVLQDSNTYDLNSFIGDVGGFLGLLLGLSVLDIYDILVKATTAWTKLF